MGNDQAHLNNSSTVADELFECVCVCLCVCVCVRVCVCDHFVGLALKGL